MNPKKLGSIANHDQEPWKTPLPQFIEHLYYERFGRERPAVIVSIERRARQVEKKKAQRKAARAARRVETAVSDGPPGSARQRSDRPAQSAEVGVPPMALGAGDDQVRFGQRLQRCQSGGFFEACKSRKTINANEPEPCQLRDAGHTKARRPASPSLALR